MKKYKTIQLVALTLILGFVPAMGEESPLRLLQQRVDRVLELTFAEEGEAQSATWEHRRKAIYSIAKKTFDFDQLAGRALGRGRKAFSEGEYKEFVDLFMDLIFRSYFDRLKDYKVQGIDYLKEVKLSQTKYEVRTIAKTKDQSYPIDYRLYLAKNGEWKVYDVIIEGVSLIRNYRTQFNNLLRSKDPEDLLKMLRQKLEQ